MSSTSLSCPGVIPRSSMSWCSTIWELPLGWVWRGFFSICQLPEASLKLEVNLLVFPPSLEVIDPNIAEERILKSLDAETLYEL